MITEIISSVLAKCLNAMEKMKVQERVDYNIWRASESYVSVSE